MRVVVWLLALGAGVASTAALAGERDEALAWLERAVAREAEVQRVFVDAAFRGHSGELPVSEATDRAYFDPRGVLFEERLDESIRDRVVLTLEQNMEESELFVLEVETDGGTLRFGLPLGEEAWLRRLPVAVLAGAATVAQPELRGAEMDFIGEDEVGSHWASALHQLDGRLVLRTTALRPRHGRYAPTSEELSERYGIGPLVDGDTRWSEHERAVLGRALREIPEADLAAIEGLPFRRHANPPPDEPDAAGFYQQRGLERSIELFDAAFEADDAYFIGSLNEPYEASVRAVVHEIGHAVAMLKPYRAIQGFGARAESLLLLYEQLGELSVSGIRSERERLERIVDQLRELQAPFIELREQAGGTLTASPVLSTFLEASGGLGPTPYGRTDLGEAFAESYMLFLLDPDALARIQPSLLTFFRSGAYQLEPLRVEPIPEIPQSVRDYLTIPDDPELEDELDALIEAEIGPL